MADNVKVLIVERNGVDLDNQEEYALRSSNIPFDNTSNGFTATDVQTAIEEAAFGIAGVFYQAKAFVAGSDVLFVCYDPILSLDQAYLTREVL